MVRNWPPRILSKDHATTPMHIRQRAEPRSHAGKQNHRRNLPRSQSRNVEVTSPWQTVASARKSLISGVDAKLATHKGKEGIVKARAVEDRLMRDTWQVDSYDLLPKLQALNIPTLVIWGDHDFIPREIAAHIARAIPNVQLVTLKDCGHFAYMECPGEVRNAFNNFFRRRQAPGRPR